MNRILILSLLVSWPPSVGFVSSAAAQAVRSEAFGDSAAEFELETDRDAFTPATTTVERRQTVLETSYSFLDHRRTADTHSFPELLVRYGLTERIELRLGWNYEVGGGGDFAADDELERESEMLYGLKAELTRQRGLVPRSAFIVQGYTPTSGESPATDLALTYALGWALTDDLRLDSSLRYLTEHDRHDAFNEWAPSVVLRAAMTERWHLHAEYFALCSDGAERDFTRAFFSPGTSYMLTPNLELGLRTGWGLTDDAADFFSNVGLGYRF